MTEYLDFSYLRDQYIFLSSVASRSALEESTDSRIKWVPEVNLLTLKWLDILLITYFLPVPRLRKRETPSSFSRISA